MGQEIGTIKNGEGSVISVLFYSWWNEKYRLNRAPCVTQTVSILRTILLYVQNLEKLLRERSDKTP